MAASANGFDDGGLAIHQVLGVVPDTAGRSGMPPTRAGGLIRPTVGTGGPSVGGRSGAGVPSPRDGAVPRGGGPQRTVSSLR